MKVYHLKGRILAVLALVVLLSLPLVGLPTFPHQAAHGTAYSPAGVTYFAALNLTNNQGTQISGGSQVQVGVNWFNFTSYLDNPVDNYVFFTANGLRLRSWLESGTANNANGSIVWVKLDGSTIIPANGNATIYLGFYPLGTNVLGPYNYTGEYPNATATYAQYDNGGYVFSWYDNFNGTSLSSKWTIIGGTQGSDFFVNDGFRAPPHPSNYVRIRGVTAANPQTSVVDLYTLCGATITNDIYWGWGQGDFSAGIYSYLVDMDAGSGNYSLTNWNGALAANVATAYPRNVLHIFSLWTNTTASLLSVDYGTPVHSATDFTASTSNYPFIAVNAATTDFMNLTQWARVRSLPPNNVQPSDQFGTPQVANPGGGVIPPPTGVVYYVNITISNTASSATAPMFDQKLNVNFSQWSSYISPTGQNIAFFDSDWVPLNAWLENGTVGSINTDQNDVVWVQLADPIPASSSVNIFMAIYGNSTNNFNPTGAWGESPQLTSAITPNYTIAYEAPKMGLISSSPVVPLGGTNGADSTYLEQPVSPVLVNPFSNGTDYIMFGGANTIMSANGLWYMQLASSTDLVHWSKVGEVINTTVPNGQYLGGGVLLNLGNGTFVFAGSAAPANSGQDSHVNTVWYTSTNLLNWTFQGYIGGINDTAETLCSIVQASNGTYYATASRQYSSTYATLDLFKSSSLTSGYTLVETIADPASAQYPYYSGAIWDGSLWYENATNTWHVFFTAGTSGSPNPMYISWAYITGSPEGNWTISPTPLYNNSFSYGVGIASFLYANNCSYLYFDRWPDAGGAPIYLMNYTSSSYGSYDNGAQVFTAYADFLSSPTTGWTTDGTFNYTMQNGLTIYGGPNNNNGGIYTTSTFGSGYIAEANGTVFVTSNGAAGFGFVHGAVATDEYEGAYMGSGSQFNYSVVQGIQDNGSAGTYTPNITTSATPGLYAVYSLNATASNFSLNGGTQYLVTQAMQAYPLNVGFYVYGTAGASPYGVGSTVSFDFARLRPAPPGGVMPSVTYGNLTSSGISITVTTSPSGIASSLTVDGVVYTGPHTFTWNVGDTHNLTANTVSGYNFQSWSDAGAQSHNIVVSAGTTTFTANYAAVQFYVTYANDGHTTVNQTSGLVNSGTVVNVLATPATNYAFLDFVNSLTGNSTSNPYGFTVTGNVTITAYSSLAQAYVTIGTFPAGLTNALVVDGVAITGPQTFAWIIGSTHSLSAVGTINDWAFSSWSDGGLQIHSITATTSTTITAAYLEQGSTSPVVNPPVINPPPDNGTTTVPPGGSGTSNITVTSPGSGYEITGIQVDPTYPWVSCNTSLPFLLPPGNSTLRCSANPPPSLSGDYKVPVRVTLKDAFGNVITETAYLLFSIPAAAQGPLSDYAMWIILAIIFLIVVTSSTSKKKKTA